MKFVEFVGFHPTPQGADIPLLLPYDAGVAVVEDLAHGTHATYVGSPAYTEPFLVRNERAVVVEFLTVTAPAAFANGDTVATLAPTLSPPTGA